MSAKQGIPSAMRKLALAAALAAVSAQANALIADGKLDLTGAGEGYQLGMSFGVLDDHDDIHYGKLYFGQDATGQYMYIQMPEGFVDNRYGNQATSANGWWSTRSFAQILNDDYLGIQWGSNTLNMDYISDCGTANVSPCIATGNSEYRSGGGGNTSGFGATGAGGPTGSTNDGSFTGSAAEKAKVLEIATSLEYNLNNGFSANTTNSSTSASWIKEVGYEIKFAANTFDASAWVDKTQAPGLISLLDPTGISPTKKGFKDYTPPTCIYGCTQVPEPGTNVLLGIGALSLLWFARRRRDARMPDASSRLLSS